MKARQWLSCVTEALKNTINHDGIEHAGYLAFLGLLAMFPFLVFMVALIGVIGQGPAGAHFITTVLDTLPPNVAGALQPRVVEIISGPPQGLLTVSILGAIWTASSAFEGLRTVLNRAYHVQTPPAYLLRRSLSIVQFLMFTCVTVLVMLLLVAIPLALHQLETTFSIHVIPESHADVSRMAFITSTAILFLAVSSLYYSLPNIKQSFISVAPGAAVAVLGWLGAAYVFTLYLSHFDQLQLVYGSLGGIIAALIFFYICNIILIFGAEFNYQLVHMLGLRIVQREEVEGPQSP